MASRGAKVSRELRSRVFACRKMYARPECAGLFRRSLSLQLVTSTPKSLVFFGKVTSRRRQVGARYQKSPFHRSSLSMHASRRLHPQMRA